ncbi:hypothetical protein AN958_01954 [Leucoagaricus sp. SymC.cos]|nr:hypothetical protein AN958_01954 [Leucoagaricus sp. SymC.cos]
MLTARRGIHNIVMRRGTSISCTVSLTVQSRADISSAAFSDLQVYSKQPAIWQAAFVETTLYAAKAGLDAAGADSAELIGGYHSGGTGIDSFKCLTAMIRDKQGNQMYFYCKSDKTFWERIHIPRNTTANVGIWNINDDYVPIT